MSRRRLLPLLALVLAAYAAAGCAKNDELIRVGNRVLTVDDYKAVARGNEASYVGTPQEAKLMLFNDLVQRELMLREAQERGLFKDSTIARLRLTTEQDVIFRATFERLVPQDVPVSEAEALRMVAWRDTFARMLVIYTMERDVSVAARQAIESGQDFGDVANRFNITGSLPPGGDLGMLSPGSLVNPLDELLRTAPLNQIVGPVASPGEGWFLVKVIERERREQPAPETQVPIVREMIRQRKVRTATIRAIQKLKHSYALKVTPSGPQDFYARMQMSSAEQLQGLGSAILPMEPRPGDANIVLATWDEGRNAPGRFTVADALSDLQRPDAQQPVWSSTPAIRSWIENRALRQVILAEGHRRLIHEEPDVRRSIQGRVDNAVIENLYQTDIIPETQATEEQVRAFFDTVKDRFQRLDEITIDTVTLPDSPTAQTLATHASHAATLADALAMAKTSGEVKRITVSFPSQEPRWQQLESMFTSLPPGGAGGPVTMEAGSMVFKVVSKVQPQMTFEELPPNVVSMLRERASDVHRDQVLRKHTEHYRKMYSPVLKPELLKKIPWPIDPPTASLQVTKPAGS